MRKIIFVFSLVILASLAGCGKNQGTKTSLEAKDFKEKIENTSNAIILDVRTPEEFAEGHLANAQNIDWNAAESEQTLSSLDPTKAYFVYCLSGGRSASAANYLREKGFKEVYELSGGMMKWRAASLPEESNSEKMFTSDEMSLEQYQTLLKNEKTVIIDIYAEWCAPCKRMAPYLTEMQKSMSDKLKIIRIDADKNPTLCKELKVDALPTIFVYKANAKTFEHIGYLSKEDLMKQL